MSYHKVVTPAARIGTAFLLGSHGPGTLKLPKFVPPKVVLGGKKLALLRLLALEHWNDITENLNKKLVKLENTSKVSWLAENTKIVRVRSNEGVQNYVIITTPSGPKVFKVGKRIERVSLDNLNDKLRKLVLKYSSPEQKARSAVSLAALKALEEAGRGHNAVVKFKEYMNELRKDNKELDEGLGVLRMKAEQRVRFVEVSIKGLLGLFGRMTEEFSRYVVRVVSRLGTVIPFVGSLVAASEVAGSLAEAGGYLRNSLSNYALRGGDKWH